MVEAGVYVRRRDYIRRLKAAGIPQRLLAGVWGCSPGGVRQRLGGYTLISPKEESDLQRLLQAVENNRKGEV